MILSPMLPYAAADGQWFDYDGEEIYGDFSVSYNGQTVTPTNLMAHEPGMAQYDHASGALHHLHGNLIGTTERMTDAAGAIAHRAVYTAFGELIEESGTVATRYGYAGAYGYQSANSQEPEDPLAELGWLHVGNRYYDPLTGRFAQRDPIGIRGGANVYVYVRSHPTFTTDPRGLQPIPTVPPFSVPPNACGPAVNSPNTDETNIIIIGDPEWYDAFGATAAALLCMPYLVNREPWCPPDYEWRLINGKWELVPAPLSMRADPNPPRPARPTPKPPSPPPSPPRPPRDGPPWGPHCPIASSSVCFVAGTPVAMTAGTMPIEDIRGSDLNGTAVVVSHRQAVR